MGRVYRLQRLPATASQLAAQEDDEERDRDQQDDEFHLKCRTRRAAGDAGPPRSRRDRAGWGREGELARPGGAPPCCRAPPTPPRPPGARRSEEHTSELQS